MDKDSLASIRTEIMQLHDAMQGFRRELAAIRHPATDDDRFRTMAEQLDAIVQGTEEATETILQSVENICGLIDEKRADLEQIAESEWLNKFDDLSNDIFQACAFQDLTGQRITKVVNSLKFVDTKLNDLVDLWGRASMLAEPVHEQTDDRPEGERLEGPALAGKGVSQDDIDKMFD